jgi:hypothetical protein
MVGHAPQLPSKRAGMTWTPINSDRHSILGCPMGGSRTAVRPSTGPGPRARAALNSSSVQAMQTPDFRGMYEVGLRVRDSEGVESDLVILSVEVDRP